MLVMARAARVRARGAVQRERDRRRCSANQDSWYYLARQLTGVGVGDRRVRVAAKIDAETWREWAWPIMWLTIVTLLLCLVLPESIAPRINGSRRFLFGSSLPAVGVRQARGRRLDVDADREEGRPAAAADEGRAAVLRRHRLLDVLAALEPDLSVAMLYTLLMAVLLFAGGVRIATSSRSARSRIPLLWHKIEKAAVRAAAPHSFLDPGGAPAEVSYQLKQSLIAVGSGGLFGVGLRAGAAAVRLPAVPVQRLHRAATSARSGASSASRAITLAFAAYALLGFRIARQARSPFLQLVAVGLTFVDGAHRVPAHRRRDRAAADDGADAAVRLVRPLEPRAHDVPDRHAREHRQHARSA